MGWVTARESCTVPEEEGGNAGMETAAAAAEAAAGPASRGLADSVQEEAAAGPAAAPV